LGGSAASVSGSTKKRKGEFSSESHSEAKAAFDPSTIPPSHHKTQEMRPVVVNAPGVVEGEGPARPRPDVQDEVGTDADAVRLPGGLPSNRLQVVETDAQLARAFAEQLESGGMLAKSEAVPAKSGQLSPAGAPGQPVEGPGARDFPTGPRLGKAARLPELHGEIVDDDSVSPEAGAASAREVETVPTPGVATRKALGTAPVEPWPSDDPPADEPREPTPSPAAVAPVDISSGAIGSEAASRGSVRGGAVGSGARSMADHVDIAPGPAVGLEPSTRPAAGANAHPVARTITILAAVGIVILLIIGLWPDPEHADGETTSAREGVPTGVEASDVGTSKRSGTASEAGTASQGAASATAKAPPATATGVAADASASSTRPTSARPPNGTAPVAKPPATAKTATPAPANSKPEVF